MIVCIGSKNPQVLWLSVWGKTFAQGVVTVCTRGGISTSSVNVCLRENICPRFPVWGKSFSTGAVTVWKHLPFVNVCLRGNVCPRFCDFLYEGKHLPQVLWLSVWGKGLPQVLWLSLQGKTFAAGYVTVCTGLTFATDSVTACIMEIFAAGSVTFCTRENICHWLCEFLFDIMILPQSPCQVCYKPQY